MQTFLIVVAGVVVGLLIVVALVVVWLKRKLKKVARDLTALVGALDSGVPPFRISLQPLSDHPWSGSREVADVSNALNGLGYTMAFDYRIPEMEGVFVRGFSHCGSNSLAAVYEHPEAGLIVDLVRSHSDHTHVLVTTGPDSGLELPPGKSVHRMDADLTDAGAIPRTLSSMHRILLEKGAGHTPVPVSPRLFPLVFSTAYAAEMDWRIRRGGVSAEEVRAAAAAGGQPPPEEHAVELVRLGWRQAIDRHVSDEVRRACSPETPGASDQTLLVVHERSLADSLADELVGLAIPEEAYEEAEGNEARQDALEALENRIRAAFEECPVSEGFERAMALLPADRQLRHLRTVRKPWPAALYARPA